MLALKQAGVFDAMRRRGDYWSVHEGLVTDGDVMTAQGPNFTWLYQRYRRTVAAAGIHDIPIIISEFYATYNPVTATVEALIRAIDFYVSQCAMDNVAAVLPFTCGALGEMWKDSSYDDKYAAPGGVVDYILSREEVPMAQTAGNANVVLLHHIMPDTDLQALLAAAAAQVEIKWVGEVTLVKSAGVVSTQPTQPDWKIIKGRGGAIFSMVPPEGVQFVVYARPDKSAQTTPFTGRVMDVQSINDAGWSLVYRANGVEMWIPPFAVSFA